MNPRVEARPPRRRASFHASGSPTGRGLPGGRRADPFLGGLAVAFVALGHAGDAELRNGRLLRRGLHLELVGAVLGLGRIDDDLDATPGIIARLDRLVRARAGASTAFDHAAGATDLGLRNGRLERLRIDHRLDATPGVLAGLDRLVRAFAHASAVFDARDLGIDNSLFGSEIPCFDS
jgi:hypothetical protein